MECRASRRYIAGKNNSVNGIENNRPPMTAIAIGWSASVPLFFRGLLRGQANGKKGGRAEKIIPVVSRFAAGLALRGSMMSTHLVSAFSTGDFGAETVRIGDLNGDGAPDLLYTQSIFGQRAITCLTAVTIYGEKLWQVGAPSAANGRIYGDLPVQIYDWDNDGCNEVLYIRQARYAEPVLYNDTPYYREHNICERAQSPIAIYDGQGTIVDEIDAPADIRDAANPADPGNYYCGRAAVWGDSRDEVLVYSAKGTQIHANRRAPAIPTLYNNTLYHGM